MFSLQQGGDSRSLRRIRKLVILTAVLSLLSSTSATAVSLGMVADNAIDRIAIFDADRFARRHLPQQDCLVTRTGGDSSAVA